MVVKITERLIERIDMLIGQASEVQKTQSHLQNNEYFRQNHVNSAAQESLRAAVLSFTSQTFGPEHTYTKELDRISKDTTRQNMREVQSVLEAARAELAGGWFTTVRNLVSAEIFTDFLEMAEYLLDEGYIHPAAVIVGSVLEEHLRQLANQAGVPTEQTTSSGVSPKKADLINAELTKAAVYGKLDQKNVTAWLDLRNKAAHGQYTAYTTDQVKNMYSGVLEFIARVTP